jgi:hypothetical protein
MQKRIICLALLLLVIGGHMPIASVPIMAQGQRYFTVQPPAQKPVNYRIPARLYTQVQMGGWLVYLEQPLANSQPGLVKKVLDRLYYKLNQSLAALPAATANEFSQLKFFIMCGPSSPYGGRDNGLEFFRANDPDYHNLLDPNWRNCVVIYSAKNYLDITDFWALKVLTHELSHAHFAMHYREDQPDLYQCWENAMRLRLYHNVKDISGKNIEKAWAATNQLEYFAELSCMYFVGCNYYPFNRQQLAAYDPNGFAIIEWMWNVRNR